MTTVINNIIKILGLVSFLLAAPEAPLAEETVRILNVSYDSTREFFIEYNKMFKALWEPKAGKELIISQSHGGSGKQARSVIDGLEADLVSLALAYDINQIVKLKGLIANDWQSKFPNNSSPFTSTIVFLVRKGNPKNVKDWDDLVRSDVEVITPNPKTSGGARWNYLAAWGYALKHYGNDESKALEFMTKIFKNVPILDTGARGSTMSFVYRELGDVLIAWESEAYLALNEFGAGRFEIVAPSISILAEPPVALVDRNVDLHGTREVTTKYLKYLYSKAAQKLVIKHHFRPAAIENWDKYAKHFEKVELFTINEMFGSWAEAQAKHFNDGGTFDKIYLGE